MAAQNTDKFTQVGSPGSATTLASPGHAPGGTTINVGSTSNWPTATGVIFAMDTYTIVNGVQVRTPGTYTEWEAVVTSSTGIVSMVLLYGTDQTYPAGTTSRVYIPVASSWVAQIVAGILVSHNQDGTLKTGAVSSTSMLGSGVVTSANIADGAVATADLADSSVTMTKIDLTTFPKFSAYQSGAFTASATSQKIPFDTEDFDIGNNFNTTLNRFVAPVVGYYAFTASVTASAANNGATLGIALYKNGTLYKAGDKQANIYVPSGTTQPVASVSALIPLAATDYVEAYIISNNLAVQTGSANTWLQGWRQS